MVKIETKRQIGYEFSKSANWNINKGLTVLKDKYHIKSQEERLLKVAKELEVRAIQYKNDNPELSKKVRDMAMKAYKMYDNWQIIWYIHLIKINKLKKQQKFQRQKTINQNHPYRDFIKYKFEHEIKVCEWCLQNECLCGNFWSEKWSECPECHGKDKIPCKECRKYLCL